MTTISLFDQFRILGDICLQVSRDWLKNPTDVAERVAVALFESGGNVPFTALSEALRQNLFVNALFAGRWAMCGYPTITLGHRTAASFCMTKMRTDDANDFVKAPWPAFAIRIPPGLLAVESEGELFDAPLLVATCLKSDFIPESKVADEDRWWWKLSAVSRMAEELERRIQNDPVLGGYLGGVSLWGFNQPTRFLAELDPDENNLDGFTRWEDEDHKAQDSDKRSERMARAMLLACSMYLSGDPRERAERASEGGITVRERKSKKRESDELPQYTEFELTSSIKLNLHHTVRDYVKHGGSISSVQTYVHGHWKRVAIGTGRAQRKLVHIQPYWRGDPDAPISARTK